MSRWQKLVVVALGTLLGLWFLLAGSQKFLAREAFLNLFSDLGLAAMWVPVIGVLEILGALLVLVPRTALYGAILIGVIMVGAVTCHLLSGSGSPIAALIALSISAVVAGPRLSSRATAES